MLADAGNRACRLGAAGMLVFSTLTVSCGAGLPAPSNLGVTTALITGELGYPAGWVPSMTVYAENLRSGEVFLARTNSSPSVTGFALEVAAPGSYRVFAWTTAGTLTEESEGSYYCGGCARERQAPPETRPLQVSVQPGDTLRGVDIFLFGDLPERVPRPPAA